jgi:hypothetical protein
MKAAGVAKLVKFAMIGRPLPFSEEDDYFFQNAREDALREQHQLHSREPAHEETAHFGRVVRAQELRRQHQCEAAISFQETRRVDGESGPGRCQRGQANACLCGGCPCLRTIQSGEILVADVRWIPDDHVNVCCWLRLEEVADLDVGFEAELSEGVPGIPGAWKMKLDPTKSASLRARRKRGSAPGRGYQECGLAAGRLED